MTDILPNPFNSTVATPPETVAQADASPPHLPDASAEVAAVRTDVLQTVGATVSARCDNSFPAAERRPKIQPGEDALNPHSAPGGLDDLEELLSYVPKRHRTYVPDMEALLDAIWADDAPMFLKRANG